MQSSSNKLSTLVSGKAKCKKTKASTQCLIIPEYICRLLAERYDTKSNVKLGRIRSQIKVPYLSSHLEEL